MSKHASSSSEQQTPTVHDNDTIGPIHNNGTIETRDILPHPIGGPGTRLPFVVESFLGWTLCLSCLSVSGYHYTKSILLSSRWYLWIRRQMQMNRWVPSRCIRWIVGPVSNSVMIGDSSEDTALDRPWIPLTTCSRAELDRQGPWERYLSLVRLLEKYYPETLVPLIAHHGDDPSRIDGLSNESLSSHTHTHSSNVDWKSLVRNADMELVRVLRHDDECRRLASLAMRPHQVALDITVTTTTTTTSSSTHCPKSDSCNDSPATIVPTVTSSHTQSATRTTTLLQLLPHNHLLHRMFKLWNRLLSLPTLEEAKAFHHNPITSESNHGRPFTISLIVPSYCEKGSHLQIKLSNAKTMAVSPKEVEVIIVNAGGCTDLDILLHSNDWGRILILPFTHGGGRGPCLNYGASHATGRILTFCHSDTSLPCRWDERIVTTLEHGEDPRVNSCSFSFGIDTSSQGLSMPFASCAEQYFPPGIRAVETTANWRSRMYSLPYGDSVLSLHACVFFFLGGFPDQCLMEDYELVSLLRLRGALFVPPFSSGRERLEMIRGSPALCSPRRWQKFGVMYVTFMNSRLVNLYAGAMKLGPDDLFRLYYGREPPRREWSLGPWELKVEARLR